jgi:hypothetical protein
VVNPVNRSKFEKSTKTAMLGERKFTPNPCLPAQIGGQLARGLTWKSEG